MLVDNCESPEEESGQKKNPEADVKNAIMWQNDSNSVKRIQAENSFCHVVISWKRDILVMFLGVCLFVRMVILFFSSCLIWLMHASELR